MKNCSRSHVKFLKFPEHFAGRILSHFLIYNFQILIERKKIFLTMNDEAYLKNGQKPPQTRPIRTIDARPDEGYAWVVAIAACAINFIMAGLNRMSGILFVAFIEAYGVDRKGASAPFSIRSSTRNLLGPIVGILGQKYGVRLTVIAGGSIASASAAACFFAEDIVWITVLWGVINGIGTAMIVVLPQVVIGQYFKKYKTTASGMAFSGGCFGSFVFPVLLEKLLVNYGVEGTFLIIGTIFLHTIPAAMILRKPIWLKARKKMDDLEAYSSPLLLSKSSEGNGVDLQSPKFDTPVTFNPLIGNSNAGFYPDIQLLKQNNEMVVNLLTQIQVDGTKQVTREIKKDDREITTELCILEHMQDMYSCLQHSRGKSQFYQNLRLARKNIFSETTQDDMNMLYCRETKPQLNNNFLTPNPTNLVKTKSVPDISKISNEITKTYVLMKLKEILDTDVIRLTSLYPEHHPRKLQKLMGELRKLYNSIQYRNFGKMPEYQPEIYQETKPSLKKACLVSNAKISSKAHSNSFWDHIKTAFGLYKKPLFLLICLGRAVHFITFIPVMTIVVDFVMDKGLREEDGKYAIAALSIGDLIGRSCLGWITDRGYITMPRFMLITMVLQGFSTASLPLMDTKIALYLSLAIFAMFQGSLFVRHPVLVGKYMGDHEQSIAMGCINFFGGILGLGLPAYIGFFRDTMNSYDYIFYINGALGSLVGLLWALEPYLRRRTESLDDDSIETV